MLKYVLFTIQIHFNSALTWHVWVWRRFFSEQMCMKWEAHKPFEYLLKCTRRHAADANAIAAYACSEFVWVFETIFEFIYCSGTHLHARTEYRTINRVSGLECCMLNQINWQEITFDLYRRHCNDFIYFYCMSSFHMGTGTILGIVTASCQSFWIIFKFMSMKRICG